MSKLKFSAGAEPSPGYRACMDLIPAPSHSQSVSQVRVVGSMDLAGKQREREKRVEPDGGGLECYTTEQPCKAIDDGMRRWFGCIGMICVHICGAGGISACAPLEMYLEDQAWRKSFRSSCAVMCLEVLRTPLFPGGKKTE